MTRTFVLLAALTAAATATAGLPTARYWTPARANTAVVTQATVPYCAVLVCIAGHPRDDPTAPTPPVTMQSATCAGIKAFARGGRYQRFTCAYVATGDVVEGTLEVRTASSTAIRWKRINLGGD